MSNPINQNETEMDPIIHIEPVIPIINIDDDRKTDCEISLSSEKKKSTNLPPVRTPSTVWQHYEKVNDNGVHVRSKCKYCNKEYSKNCSTTTLNDHWKKKHQKIQPGGVGSIEAAFNNAGNSQLQTEDHADTLDKLVDWVIDDCQPFRVVDGALFREFIANLNPRFRVPSRQTLRNKIDNKYANYKNNIIKLFQVNL